MSVPNVQRSTQNSFSLTERLNIPHIDLIDLIHYLHPISPVEAPTLKDLAERITEIRNCTGEDISSTRHLVYTLILKQFPDLESILREIIVNGNDAGKRKASHAGVRVELQGSTCIVSDNGDSLTGPALVTWLVPSRSSNTGSADSKTVGKFGQGGLSMFYYLLYPLLNPNAELFSTFIKDNQIGVNIWYLEEGHLKQATFYSNDGNVNEKSVLRKQFRKITVLTRREAQTLYMKFCLGAKGIECKLFENGKRKKDGSISLKSLRDSEGTTITINSPLIQSSQNKLLTYIQETFQHVSAETPITLNGQLVNSLHSLNSLKFPEGELLFSAPNTSRNGTLIICEKGVRVIEYPTSGFVPEKMVINFNYLPLTAERASLNFTDARSAEFVKKILESILNHSELSFKGKGALLNALLSIIGKEEFNLVPFLNLCVNELKNNNNIIILPDEEVLHNLKQQNLLFLNRDYLQTVDLPLFYSQDNYNLYLIDDLPATPIVITEIGDRWHLFLSSCFFDAQSSIHTSFNFYLLNKWLELNQHQIRVNVPGLLKVKEVAAEQTSLGTNSSQIEANASVSWRDFENAPDANMYFKDLREFITYLLPCLKVYDPESYEILNKMNLDLSDFDFFEELKASYKNDKKMDVLFFILDYGYPHFCSGGLPKKFIRFIFENFKNDPFFSESPELTTKFYSVIHRFLESIEMAREPLNLGWLSISLECIKSYLLLHPEEKEFYLTFLARTQFLSNFIIKGGEPGDGSTALFQTEIQSKYAPLKQILLDTFGDLANSSDFSKIQHFDRIAEIPVDVWQALAKKLSMSNRQRLLILINEYNFKDLSNLYLSNNLSEQELDLLIECIESMKKSSLIYDCKDIISKNLKNIVEFTKKLTEGSLKTKSEWLQLYIALSSIEDHISIFESDKKIKFNWELIDHLLLLRSKQIKNHQDALYHAEETKKSFQQILNWINEFSKVKKQINEIRATVEKPQEENKFYLKCHSPKEWIEIHDQLSNLLNQYQANQSDADWQSYCNAFFAKLEIFLNDKSRPFLYCAFIQEKGNFLSEKFVFPKLTEARIPLEQDPDVKRLLKTKDDSVAAARIKHAIKQNSQKYFWILEFLKNCLEAGTTQIICEAHLSEDGDFIFRISDLGQGMGLEELAIFKTPGETSKRKEIVDGNHGIGAFSVFSFADELFLQTSNDGQAMSFLIFQKTPHDGLTIQSKLKQPFLNCGKGTSFVLKKKMSSKEEAHIELVEIKAKLVSICQKMNVKVIFQKQQINMLANQVNPSISHQEPFIENGTCKGEIKVEASRQQGGVYRKNLRLGDISSSYMELVPEELKKVLNDQCQYVSLYLPPEAEQVLNRSHLVDREGGLIQSIQHTLLMAYIKFACLRLKQGDQWEWLSRDLWKDFRFFHEKLEDSKEQKIQALIDGNWNFFSLNQQAKKALLNNIQTFFDRKKLSKIIPVVGDKDVKINELCELIEKQWLAMFPVNSELKNLILNTRSLTEVLIRFPLQEKGYSFRDIRNSIREQLIKNSIILKNGSYNQLFIKQHTKDELTQTVQICMSEVTKVLGLDNSYTFLLEKFSKEILERCHVIQNQSSREPPKNLKKVGKILGEFLKTVSKEILNRNILINFYSASDGAVAYALPENGIAINYLSKHFADFVELINWCNKQPSMSVKFLSSSQIKILIDWFETLTHEITHHKENLLCRGTHDAIFKSTNAQMISELLVKNSEINVLKIFEDFMIKKRNKRKGVIVTSNAKKAKSLTNL